MALACRELPPSLDLLEPLLAGRVDMLTAAELRFSAEDTAASLGKRLSGRELAAIDREYAGWPVALALLRAAGPATSQDAASGHATSQDDASRVADSAGLLGNWIESRLWQRFPAAQRDFLLDAGLMDELDPVLLGRAGEAERAWRAGALPAGDEDCLDMKSLDWRELEMLACARLRLYMACKDYETGWRFAKKLLSLVTERRLMRTAMRVLALLAALEWRAGDQDAACSHLETFLRHYIEADYARPVLREGNAVRQALKRWLESQPDSTARDLLKMIDADEKKHATGLTERKMTVLKLLPDLRDKQIAAELSISRAGVRFHVGRIFAKLGVHSRSEAVYLARSIGLLRQSP